MWYQVCVLAVLTSTAVHRLQLGFNHGHHSRPRGSSTLRCYQHDEKQQDKDEHQGSSCCEVKSGDCICLTVVFLFLLPLFTHFPPLEGFCVSLMPQKNSQINSILKEGISKHLAPLKDEERKALRGQASWPSSPNGC